MSEQHRKLGHLFGMQGASDERAIHGIAPADTKGGGPNVSDGEITKEITGEVVPITTASQKPDKVRRPRCSKKQNKPTVGFEPSTCGLRNRCSTTELRRHGIHYTEALFSLVPAGGESAGEGSARKAEPFTQVEQH